MSHGTQLSLSALREALTGDVVAIRRTLRLQPAGMQGDKVFPPTYEGGEYAQEDRVLEGRRVPCVLLDSVQSQANRMELALRQACYRGPGADADIPVVTVDFASAGLPEVGEVTSLDAPHRLADAILRDSVLGETAFRASEAGQVLDVASSSNATGLFGVCPTALLFGLWDSTGPRGGLGVKFQRAIVSEIFGADAQVGLRPSSRIDPLGIELNAGPVYQKGDDGDWTTEEGEARRGKDGKPAKYGKDGKPSEINHGNVTPSLRDEKGRPHPGGVTFSYALQTVVLSLVALRRMHFPAAGGKSRTELDAAAWVALAALGLAAADLSIRAGCDLRSRCLLVPDTAQPSTWQLVRGDGTATDFAIADSLSLLREAAQAAQAAGLPAWRKPPVVLLPSQGLVNLVKRSRDLKVQSPSED